MNSPLLKKIDQVIIGLMKNIPLYRKTYDYLVNNQNLTDITEILIARISNIRDQSSKLIFVDIVGGHLSADVPIADLITNNHIQIMITKSKYSEFDFPNVRSKLFRGNIIKVTGYPCRTSTGELSICAKNIDLISACQHPLPFELKEAHTRATQRYYDLIVNRDTSLPRFIVRSRVISQLRSYLERELSMVEVETSILSSNASGAVAKPFVTHHNAQDTKCFLRIAPELNLKRLVVGGFDGVFEIGKQFRNEDADVTHNPEFTSCEFYKAYATYLDLMSVTENILYTITTTVLGKSTSTYMGHEINWKGPYAIIDILPELEKQGIMFPTIKFDSLEMNDFLDKVCLSKNIACSAPRTTTRLLDKLISTYIEPQCIQPTFVTGHPAIMCPLAKRQEGNTELTERFELFVCGKELCNAYSELNDSAEQLDRFKEQSKDKKAGDDEIGDIDEDFCNALSYGMPYTAGWGIGIDRLVMMLTNAESIKDVILFPY